VFYFIVKHLQDIEKIGTTTKNGPFDNWNRPDIGCLL
jgi:hypothetical protein